MIVVTRETVKAGIYCRISSDRAGDELGIDRQREDCEKLAKKHGWRVAETFVDNDLSAFSGRTRPGYDRLLDAVKAGEIGAVIAWHPDRLHRSPRELEHFIDVVNVAAAEIATVVAGEYDLGTAAGRMTARVVGAVGRHESEQKSERIRRQREQMAMQGRPHGGRRAYGYDPTGSEIVDTEAGLIREAVGRVIAGDSLRTIARDWNARGILSSSGRAWTITSLRSMLTGPRLCGLRIHRGEVVGPGNWPAILTQDEHDEIRAVLGNPRVHRAGRPPTSLLGGLIVCGLCGTKMHASTRVGGARRYMCPVTPGAGEGCGRVAITAERTEKIVVEAVIRRLDTPTLAQVLGAPEKSSSNGDIVALEARLAELADVYAAGEITRGEWMRARSGIEERLERSRRARDEKSGQQALIPYQAPGALRAAWPNLSTEQQRAILSAVIECVVIDPAARPGQFDADRISIPGAAWRA